MILVKRSSGAPRVLVESSAEDRYRHEDVVKRLIEVFHHKCYICEISPVTDPEVEHRLPHKNNTIPGRKYDWNNLFYACRHCNSVKSKSVYDAGIIDCCARDPELLLAQRLIENRVSVVPLDKRNQEAVLTAKLIEEVFMTDNPALRSEAADARLKDLQRRMNVVLSKLSDYKEGHDALAADTLKALLGRERPFAGFVRHYVREHIDEYPELKPYLA